MTIGHLGRIADWQSNVVYMAGLVTATAFLNKGPKEKLFGDLLTKRRI